MDLTSNTSTFVGAGFSSNKRRTNTYKFPILKTADLIQCLKELSSTGENVVLTKEELEEPQHCKEKIRNVFSFLLSYCAGKDANNLKPTKAMLEFASNLEYPDMHHPESFGEMQFFLALRQLMEQCLYNEFSWRDLHVPTSKRLRTQLSALINLVKYLEGDQLKLFNELNEPRAELIQALEEVQDEHEQLKKTLAQTEANADQKRTQMAEVMRECEQLESEIARNNRLQTAARREAAVVKKKVNDLNDQLQTAQWALQESEAEEEKLRTQVVTSPERRKAELLESKLKLQNEKDECARLDRLVQDCKAKYANALKLYQEFHDCIKDIDELKEEIVRYTDVFENVTRIRKEIDETVKRTDEINMQCSDTERDLYRCEEKLKSQRIQHQLKMRAIQESLDYAKAELLQAEKSRREATARIESGEKEVKSLQALIEHERKKSENEIQGMIEQYKNLEKKFLEKNTQRMSKILSVNMGVMNKN